MNTTPTASQHAAAAQLLAEPSRWTSARRKRDGKPFWIIRGSKGATYYADGAACTCPSARHRGCCSHSLAVQIREGRR